MLRYVDHRMGLLSAELDWLFSEKIKISDTVTDGGMKKFHGTPKNKARYKSCSVSSKQPQKNFLEKMMRQNITVSIIDHNRFFSAGLKLLLQTHFHQRGMDVKFLPPHKKKHAKLLFQAKNVRNSAQFCRQRPLNCEQRAIIITDTQHNSQHFRRVLDCLSEKSTIARTIKPDELFREVEKNLARADLVKSIEACPRCAQDLSRRERDILLALRFYSRNMQAASLLHLSPKTISGHKRRIMEKLGFERNTELYHWLQHGGLNEEYKIRKY